MTYTIDITNENGERQRITADSAAIIYSHDNGEVCVNRDHLHTLRLDDNDVISPYYNKIIKGLLDRYSHYLYLSSARDVCVMVDDAWKPPKDAAKERDEYAAKHLAKVRSEEVERLHEKIVILQEQQKGLLALIGYMSHKTGFSDFSLNQIQRFGRRYETNYRVDSETAADGVEEIKRVYIEHVVKGEGDGEDQ